MAKAKPFDGIYYMVLTEVIGYLQPRVIGVYEDAESANCVAKSAVKWITQKNCHDEGDTISVSIVECRQKAVWR